LPRAAFGVIESLRDVGDVGAQCRQAFARYLLSDQVCDQQAKQRLALESRECGGGPRVFRQCLQPFSVSV
jgi:hypothetical protein